MPKEINITWTTDDVFDVAEEHDITLSETQCEDILSIVESNHDANIGINWDVIYYAIQHYTS